MTTLRELIAEHGATHFGYEDAGNGSAFGGALLPYDEDADRAYGDLPLAEESGTAPSGYVYAWRSEWSATGAGSNPYRYRVLF